MYVEIVWAHKYISQKRSTYVIIIPLKCFCDQQTPSGTRKQLPNMPDNQNPPLSSLLSPPPSPPPPCPLPLPPPQMG